MGQMLAVPENFGDSVRYPRKRKNSNKFIELDALSPISHPQDGVLATRRALEVSDTTPKCTKEQHTANICLQENERPQSPPPPPTVDTSPSRKTFKKREPSRTSEETPNLALVRMTKVSDLEPTQAGLPDLPTEIILNIGRYLPSSSLLSLSYTCRVIRYKMGVSIEHSLGKRDIKAQLPRSTFCTNLPSSVGITGRDLKPSLPTVVPNVHHSERLKLLCMLDRDGKLPPSKAVCSGCADTHDQSLFSRESLAQPSHERQCLGSAGRVWICPHWILDHNLVSTSERPSGSHMCGKRWVCVIAVRDKFPDPTVIWPITVLGCKNDAPSKKLVNDILARTDMSVCKHLRFADAFISRLYSPDCTKLWAAHFDPFCRCSMCVRHTRSPNPAGHLHGIRGGKCRSCGTKVHFSIHPDINGRETLHLVVRRNVSGFRGCTDPAWIARVNDPVECKELERQWQKATDEKVGGV